MQKCLPLGITTKSDWAIGRFHLGLELLNVHWHLLLSIR